MTNKQANTGVAEIDNESEDEEDEEKSRSSIMVSMPIEMKTMVQQKAKEAGTSTVAFVREHIAGLVGYDGPLTKGRTVTRFEGTPEERKAARKQVAKQRRDIFSKLLAKYNGNLEEMAADLIDDDEDDDDEEDE